jgi:hypothetical protein
MNSPCNTSFHTLQFQSGPGFVERSRNGCLLLFLRLRPSVPTATQGRPDEQPHASPGICILVKAGYSTLACRCFLLESVASVVPIRCQTKKTFIMRSNSPKPLPATFPAWIFGLVMCCVFSVAIADEFSDVRRLLKQGQTFEALQKVDAQIANRPKELQGRFLKGLILVEMGRSAEAIVVFKELTEDFPEQPEPYNNLAVLYAQQKQYNMALTVLEMAVRTHPGYAIAHENLGDVYARLASHSYDQALQLDPSNKATQFKLSKLREFDSARSGSTSK